MVVSNGLDGGIREACVSEGGSGAGGRCGKEQSRITPGRTKPGSLRRSLVAALLAAPCLLFLGSMHADARAGQQWFAAWTVSHGARLTAPILTGESVRMIIRPTISGNAVRVKLENTLGQFPVTFSAAYIGQLQAGAALVLGSNMPLIFSGFPDLTLAPGAGAWSDPVNFHVAAFERYAISLDVASASDISAHTTGLVTNYMAPGAHAADPSPDGFVPVPNLDPVVPVSNPAFPFYWVASVDVRAPSTTGTIVAFGDSITDGRCSTRTNNGAANGVVLPDIYNRWADLLAERLASLPADQVKAVANEGIGGNRIVSGGVGPTALARMDRDVLERAGATHVIFFEGTNDIAGGATAATVIGGSQQVIDRAHAAGLTIIGVTVIPRGSSATWTNDMEQQRLIVNDWIRNVANFDGLIDFAELLRGPVVPANNAEEILPAFSCFDGIHPNPAGYEAMGDFIDLSLFKNIRVGRSGPGAESSMTCAPAGQGGNHVSTAVQTRTACEPPLTTRRGLAQ
jgi:lysophospholipase L1-like esterase